MDLTTATLSELIDRRSYNNELISNGQGSAQLSDEQNVISNRIAELEMIEQSQAAELETVTAEAAKFMDGLDFEGVDPKDIFINNTAEAAAVSYAYVNSVIQNAIVALKKAELAKVNSLESTIAALQEKYDQSESANEQLNVELSNKTLEIADLNSRFSNASRLLDEEKAEVKRLNDHINDLQTEIAVGASAAMDVVEVDVRTAREKYDEQRRKEEEAKPLIYNIRWKDAYLKTTYVANLVENDEEIEFSYLLMSGDISPEKQSAMKGKYRVVTSLEADTFRAAKEEQERDNADRARLLELEKQPVTVPSFRDDSTESSTDDSASAEPGLVEESPAVVGSTVTREEFEALAFRVATVEANQSIGATFKQVGEVA